MIIILLESLMATNPFKKYETDKAKEADGTEIVFDGMTFICRRAGGINRAYRAAMAMFSGEERFTKALNSTDTNVSLGAEDRVTMEAFAESVVIGWRDVLGRDDQPLPFTKENFLDLMDSCPDVWIRVRVLASNVEAYLREQVDATGEATGN